MVELDLSHNNISQIKQDTFTGNDRLQTLTLSHNFISQLSPYQVLIDCLDCTYSSLSSAFQIFKLILTSLILYPTLSS